MQRERAKAVSWKQSTQTLPDGARHPAPYIRGGQAQTGPLPFCLPIEHAALSLLPEVRPMALDLFAELGIPWHAGIGGGPGNHLLSSQVQCVNALGQMVHDPDRIVRAFGSVLDIDEVLEVEPGRFLTFEYIGPTDFFGEVPDGERTRGARCTSVDAAFLFRSSTGERELALVEWKYTESYRPRKPEPAKDEIRRKRYRTALHDPDGAVHADVLPFKALLDEPIYQLVRQQLLAWELEKARVHDVDRVRIVHVIPSDNLAYGDSLSAEHRTVGDTVHEVWHALLRRPDRFLSLDSSVFADPSITSPEYVDRYGDVLAWDEDELLRLCGGDIEALVYDEVQFSGNVTILQDGLRLWLVDSNAATNVDYPFTLTELAKACDDVEESS
ncbi:MAG TPA: hypothetical protein DCS55_00225 [Acidimicrobiaceae bacterium]|nr:hypothetical protein [Acidimicrobiaceae bacterium]